MLFNHLKRLGLELFTKLILSFIIFSPIIIPERKEFSLSLLCSGVFLWELTIIFEKVYVSGFGFSGASND